MKKFLLILIVFVLSVAASIFVLSNHKKAINEEINNLPETAIINVIKDIQAGNTDDIYDYYQAKSNYNTKEDLNTFLQETYGNINLNNLVISETEDGCYNLIENGNLVSTVELTTQNNHNILVAPFGGDVSVKVEVPAGETLYVNGIEVTSDYLTDKKVKSSYYSDIPSYDTIPVVDVYEVNDLIHTPELSLTSSSSVVQNALTGTYYVGKTSNESVEQLIVDATYAIARFPAEDGSLGAIGNYALYDSDFYKRISTLQNQWFTPHNISKFLNTEVLDITWLSEDSFICNVVTDYYMTNGSLERTYYIGYQMSFLKANGSYKIAGFAIDNDMNPRNTGD